MRIRVARNNMMIFLRLAAFLLLLSGLATPAVLGEDGRRVTHALGVTTVLAQPKRIVAFDLSVLDSIDALDVPGLHFAVPKQTMPPYLARYLREDVLDAGGMKEPNLERIYEFGPDVIFISLRQTDYYDKLSEIAPTVCANVDYADFLASFQANMAMLGDIFDRPDLARERAADLVARARSIAAKAERSGRKGLVVMVNDGAISAYGPGSRFGLIHDVLGVEPADPGIRVSTHGQSVDFEYLAKIDPDLLFVINRNAAIGTNPGPGVLDNELIQNTRAGKAGRIVSLDSSVWYLSGAGLESLPTMLDEVERALD